jgi:flagellar basal body rod protein FlgB
MTASIKKWRKHNKAKNRFQRQASKFEHPLTKEKPKRRENGLQKQVSKRQHLSKKEERTKPKRLTKTNITTTFSIKKGRKQKR